MPPQSSSSLLSRFLTLIFLGVLLSTTARATSPTAPVLLSTTPVNNATGVAGSTNIVLTFDQSVFVGSGVVQLVDMLDGSDTRTFNLPAPTIFISEYVEGSSNNKAIEIYNPFDTPFSLSGCSLKLYANGATTAGFTLNLTETIPARGTVVYVHASASLSLTAVATTLVPASGSTAVLNFNGDDVIELVANSTVLDAIGQVGNRGTGGEWGTGLTSTADNTLRRKATILQGRSNHSSAFDPSEEWDGYTIDTFNGLGAHTVAATTTITLTPSSNLIPGRTYSVQYVSGTFMGATGSQSVAALTAGTANFTVANAVSAPTIASVSPVSGSTSGSTSVTVVGTNLTGAAVTFGGSAGTGVVVAGDGNSLTVNSPIHAAGAVDVVVTTGGGSATLTNGFTYTAPVSTDASLSALVLSQGTLTPTFAAGTVTYAASVGTNVTSLTVTPTANDAGASVKVNASAAASGSPTTIPLSVGANTITILVTAADTTTTRTYTVTVTRAAPANPTITSATGPAPGTYHIGNVLSFTLNFSQAIAVSGLPRLPLSLGGPIAVATYDAVNSTSTALKFNYTVQNGDSVGAAGIIVYDMIDANGASITAVSDGSAIINRYTPPSGSGIIIDTVKPAIVASPGSRSIGIGGTSKTTLTVAATGNGLTYLWRKGSNAIPTATNATYTINPVTVADAGSYDCVVTNANGSATSGTGTITVLPNPIVYSGTVSVGANGAKAYFAIEGSAAKTLILAAYGPALTGSGNISDPQITVTDASGATVASNDNWGTISDPNFATAYSRLGLPSLTGGSKDAVVFYAFPPGSYQVTVSGVGGATGAALLALADADLNPPSRLAYVAIRGAVAAGAPLTGGFRMSNSAAKKILVRAIGPSLGAGGIADPSLALYDSDGTTVVASNGNWGGTTPLKNAFSQAGAFSLADASLDAAILGNQTIGTGSYTAQITAASGTGDALFEIYDLDGSNNAAYAPVITAPPADVSAAAGPVSFTVGASGGGTLTYAWKKGSTSIPTATSSSLTLPTITTADSGTYSVTVTSGANSATTSATLKVIPAITSPATASATYGTAITVPYTIQATNGATSFAASGLPPGLSVDSATGQITGTPTAVSGSPYNVTITATNADGTGTGTVAFTINKAALTLTGIAGVDKVYDGSTAASVTYGAAILNGKVGADSVSYSTSVATAAFADRTVASGKTVTVTGVTLVGPDAGNYTLTNPTSTAAITPKALDITGVSAVSTRSYDGTNIATLSGTAALLAAEAAGTGSTSDGKPYAGDTIVLGGTPAGAFASKNVGTAKVITVSGLTLSGADSGNYSVTQPAGLTADVTTKALTVTGLSAVATRVYDGTAVAGLTGTAALLTSETAGTGTTVDGKPYTGDTVAIGGIATGAFASKVMGTAKTITVTGLTLTGTDSANYTVTQPTGLSANVTAKAITVSGITVANKTYDGTPTGTPTYAGANLVGVISPDAVTLVNSGGVATFSSKTVAPAKTVVFTGLTLAGADSSNYSLTQPTTTADITAKNLTVAGITANNKTYDGTATATLVTTSAQLVGVVNPDVVTLTTSGATGSFSDVNAGGAKTVTVTGLVLAGADSGNYSLTQPSTTASIGRATATVAISNLNQTYDGQPKPVTVTVSPSLAATVLYAGSLTVPTNAGTYPVAVSVGNTNFAGGASATLTIAKAPQTVSLAIAGGSFAVGTSHALTATSTSGGPITYSVVAGAATIAGSSVTVTQVGSVTIRATQAGGDNYLPATADQSFAGVSGAKQNQTISFAVLPTVTSDVARITLTASASSGLPVSFSVIGGTATISGTNTLVLSGSTGFVSIRASQAGNADFEAAPDVVRSFVVVQPLPDIYFGDLSDDPSISDGRGELLATGGARLAAKRGDVAAVIYAGTNRGTVAIVAPSLNLNVSVDFVLAAGNQYTSPFTSNGRALTLTGSVANGTLTGRIAALGVSFSTPAVARTGATSTIAGIYETDAVNSATGGTTTIVSATGQVLVVTSVGNSSTGAVGTIDPSGGFSLTGTGVTIKGAVDAPRASVSGTVTVAGQSAVPFDSLSALAAHTDRLINLSSRVRIAPTRTLITGFVIGGTAPKRVLIRAVGPTLGSFGVSGALVNPKLSLFDGASKLLLENDDWSGADVAAAFAVAGAFALPAGSKDAAILTTLQPGAYSAQLTAGAETGAGLIEIYDASADAGAESQRLVNISTRGNVEIGSDGLLIGGFVVTGNVPKKVLIRGVGPGLANFGVAGTLVDPQLSVFNGSTLIARNDDWSAPTPINAQQSAASAAELAAAAQSVGAFALSDGSKDAAVVITLAPGAYTAQVTGANGAAGTAIVEIYELP